MNSRISIVIPIYNESETLAELIRSISSQTLLPEEVIFVDSGSTDDSISIIRTFSQSTSSFRIKVYSNPRGMPGGNRNIGIREARGEWIAFLDAGVIPDSDWLKSLMDDVSSRNLNALYGLCRFNARTVFQKAVCAISYGYGAYHPVLPASLFHSSIFTAVGFFREDLRSSEDILWLMSLEKILGPRQICSAAFVSYSHFPKDFPQLIRKWWFYEKDAVKSGIVSTRRSLLNIGLALCVLACLIASPAKALWSLLIFAVLRGGMVVLFRSKRKSWVLSHPWSAVLSIGVCFIRDFTKISSQMYFFIKNLIL